MAVELHSLVAGEPAGGEGSGGWIERANPARPSELVGRVAALDAAGTAEAVEAAHRAFEPWAAMPAQQRGDLLLAAADAVAATADDLGPLLASELGKIAGDCAGEMGFAAAYLRFVVDAYVRVSEPSEVDDDAGRLRIIKRPYGVCAAIVPWNAPLILSILKVAPALVCGNTIVVKPSPLAPLAVTAALTTIAEQLPPGVLSVVHGDVEVGETLVGHPLVRKVAFTGGGTVAKAVATTAAQQVTPVVLELGGNDAALVLDDAPFDDEMYERLVWGTFLTSGQVCMAAKRLYVPAGRIEEFVEGYLAAADRLLVMGDPLDPAVTIGPVASPAQMRNVEELVADALRRGGVVHELGTVGDGIDVETGWFCRPTLVAGALDDWPVVTEEQFGPTVPLLAYESVDEVVDRINADRYGLASSVWSMDEERAFEVAERIEAGFTFVNCHNRAGMSLRAPFGGWKQSGYGREFGDAGVADYLQSHSIHVPSAMRLGTHAPEDHTSANAYPT